MSGAITGEARYGWGVRLRNGKKELSVGIGTKWAHVYRAEAPLHSMRREPLPYDLTADLAWLMGGDDAD